MMFLLLFWLPLMFVASISGIEEKRFHRIAYFFGMIIGGIVFPLVSFFMPLPVTCTDTFGQYWLYSFLSDAAVPLLCLLVLYLPAAYWLSCRSCSAGSSFLLGLLTIKIYMHLFAVSNNPKLFPLAFIVLTYTSAIFIFKGAAAFSMRVSFPLIAGYFFGAIAFIVACALGFFGIAVWYFNESAVVCYGIFLLLIGAGAASGIAAALFSDEH